MHEWCLKMENKKGNIFFGFMIGIFIWIMGMLIFPFLTDDITTTRTDLDCTNTSISDGTKLSCLTVDVVAPYFIWFLISIAVGFVAGSFT